MKTLEEIKREYARGRGFTGLLHMEYDGMIEARDVDEISRRYAKELARESLKNASENAEFIAEHQFYEETIKDSVDNVGSHLVFIDKQSILNESNIPEL